MSDDEIIELPVAPVGSRVRLGTGEHASVRAISPGGSRMLVCADGSEEVWLDASDQWELSDEFAAPVATGGASEGADADVDLDSSPILENWRWTADGALCGYVYGKSGYRDGELMTTSVVPAEGRFDSHVVTGSGSAYRLGQRAPNSSGTRRSSRAVGKESLLDAFAESLQTVPEAPELLYAVGGAEAGGSAAERIMRGAFSVLDDNLVMLRAQYSAARRVVLLKDETPVAAAVVEVHPEQSVLEVPILAADRSLRQLGHGSILVAILKELGSRLRLRLLVVSATQESQRFLLRQGLHAAAHCQVCASVCLFVIVCICEPPDAPSVFHACMRPAERHPLTWPCRRVPSAWLFESSSSRSDEASPTRSRWRWSSRSSMTALATSIARCDASAGASCGRRRLSHRLKHPPCSDTPT